MKIVLDTNVLVSGLLDSFSSSGKIVQLVASGEIRLCYDVRIISEYKEVLMRPKFSFGIMEVDNLLAQVENCGYAIVPKPLMWQLPDRDDESFLEVALSGKVEHLVTGNLRHYPRKIRQGVSVKSPAEFLDVYRKSVSIESS